VVDTPPGEQGEQRPVFLAFPEHAVRLRRLLEVDDDLNELCADFDAVATAYRRGTRDDPALRDTTDEYHSLRIELEAEILDRLRQGIDPGATGV
jgi:hypothetical protein